MWRKAADHLGVRRKVQERRSRGARSMGPPAPVEEMEEDQRAASEAIGGSAQAGAGILQHLCRGTQGQQVEQNKRAAG